MILRDVWGFFEISSHWKVKNPGPESRYRIAISGISNNSDSSDLRRGKLMKLLMSGWRGRHGRRKEEGGRGGGVRKSETKTEDDNRRSFAPRVGSLEGEEPSGVEGGASRGGGRGHSGMDQQPGSRHWSKPSFIVSTSSTLACYNSSSLLHFLLFYFPPFNRPFLHSFIPVLQSWKNPSPPPLPPLPALPTPKNVDTGPAIEYDDRV